MHRRWFNLCSGEQERSVLVGSNGKGGLVHALSAWRTVTALAAEAGLAEGVVRSILAQYAAQGVVVQNPKDASLWAYWERIAC